MAGVLSIYNDSSTMKYNDSSTMKYNDSSTRLLQYMAETGLNNLGGITLPESGENSNSVANNFYNMEDLFYFPSTNIEHYVWCNCSSWGCNSKWIVFSTIRHKIFDYGAFESRLSKKKLILSAITYNVNLDIPRALLSTRRNKQLISEPIEPNRGKVFLERKAILFDRPPTVHIVDAFDGPEIRIYLNVPRIFPQVRTSRFQTIMNLLIETFNGDESSFPIMSLLANKINLSPTKVVALKGDPDCKKGRFEIYFECSHCFTKVTNFDLIRNQNIITKQVSGATKLENMLEGLLKLHNKDCVVFKKQIIEGEYHFSKEEGTISRASSNSSLKNEVIWAPKRSEKEMIMHLLPTGDLLQINPALVREVWATFVELSYFHLSRIGIEYELPPEEVPHLPYCKEPEPRMTALNYFFVQTPPEQSGSQQPQQIPIQDARRRIREVHYDRGTIVNQMDIEAKEMADFRRRYDSFSKSEYLKGKAAAYQLAQKGFFFVGDRNAVGKLRCSFCRRTIHMFVAEDAYHIWKDFDRRFVALLHRHSHLSATCPFSLGLNGDDKSFSADDIARIVEPLLRSQQIQINNINLCTTSLPDWTLIRSDAGSILKSFSNEELALDGEYSNAYYNLLAEYSYERFTQFETDPQDGTKDYEVEDDLLPQSTPVDYYLGVAPKYPNYWSLLARIETFNMEPWYRHPLSQSGSELLKPESFARVGFFYSGTADNVMCFWCGLGLNHWEPCDDPLTEHARSTPRCTWLLRICGRQRIKWIYMKAQGPQSGVQALQDVKLADYVFLKDVDDIAGVFGCEAYSYIVNIAAGIFDSI